MLPVRAKWVPQQAQQSAPSIRTMRTSPSISFLLRYSRCVSSSGVGTKASIGTFFQMTSLAKRSIFSASSRVMEPLKSIVTASLPMWKPTLSYPKSRWVSPEKMCSPLCCWVISRRLASSTSPRTRSPTASARSV